jgi:uncharacterized coiled-coil protein SlyX
MDVSKLTSRFKRKEKPPGDAAAPAAKAGAAAKLPFMRREPKLESTPPGGEAAAKIKPVRVPKDPSKRIKKMGLLKSSKGQKFILLIGDEGAILVYLKDNAVQSRHFVPDASPQNLEELQQAFAVDTKAPLIIVIDTMDQSFVQQTLPPVSALSINKLIKRRLDRDFGANDIKGAMVLGREEGGRKDWNFLMVSLEKTPQLSVWFNFAFELPNSFRGIYLLSVESEIIVKNLEQALGIPKEGTGSAWKFFVTHNKVGGFRQVILHNGKLIFTRLAQAIGESTPEVIAGNIEQEMLSTIEYMKRLSFDPATGLDIYIVASSAIKDIIDKNRFNATSISIFTPFEIAQFFGIEGATQPGDQFGDVILAAAIGCNKKHVLPLSTPEAKQFNTLYTTSQLQRIGGVLATLGIIGYAGNTAYTIYTTYSNIAELEERKSFQQKGLQTLHSEIDNSHIEVEKASDMIALYAQLQKQAMSPLPFIDRMETVLRPPIAVKGVLWALEDKPAAPPVLNNTKMVGTVTLDFPGVVTPEAFKVVSKKVLEDIKTIFKGYNIAYTKMPSRFLETEKTDMTFSNQGEAAHSDAGADSHSGVIDTQLTIKGLAMLPPLQSITDKQPPAPPIIPTPPGADDASPAPVAKPAP